MTRTSGYNIAIGLIVAVGSFTYGFGSLSFQGKLSLYALVRNTYTSPGFAGQPRDLDRRRVCRADLRLFALPLLGTGRVEARDPPPGGVAPAAKVSCRGIAFPGRLIRPQWVGFPRAGPIKRPPHVQLAQDHLHAHR